MRRYVLTPDAWLYACDDGEQILAQDRDEQIPQFFWGEHPFLRDYSERNDVPLLAALGRPRESVAPDPTPDDGEVHTLHVQGNVYMLLGDGGNIAVQVGEQGAFVVDLSLPGSFFASADIVFTATIIGHQNVQNRMHERPTQGWPSDTFLELRRRKFFNDEAIEIFYQPNAVTDGDSIVHFRKSDVIVAGDIFNTTHYPFIDLAAGGSLLGEIDALKFILDRTVYEHQMDGGTRVIPGHGYVSNEYEVAEYRDMPIRERVQAAIDTGASLEEVQAARPSMDYDSRYGANEGPWTSEMFVEAVYRSLQNAQ